MGYYTYNNELCHHGTKGQKWGVRRYQNPDGSLTDAGRRRYYSDMVKAEAAWDKASAEYKSAKKSYRSDKKSIKKNKELSRAEKKQQIKDAKANLKTSKTAKNNAMYKYFDAEDAYESEVYKKVDKMQREAGLKDRMLYGKDVWESAIRNSDASNIPMEKAVKIAKTDYLESQINAAIERANKVLEDSNKDEDDDEW